MGRSDISLLSKFQQFSGRDIILAYYVYYMLNCFKTSHYIHHPLEIWLQDKSITDYIKHPVGSDTYDNKVCPLGHLVGKILGLYIIGRYFIGVKLRKRLNTLIWISVLFGSLIMNLNVFVYLLPAYLLDISIK